MAAAHFAYGARAAFFRVTKIAAAASQSCSQDHHTAYCGCIRDRFYWQKADSAARTRKQQEDIHNADAGSLSRVAVPSTSCAQSLFKPKSIVDHKLQQP
jgi:hypothetical protein